MHSHTIFLCIVYFFSLFRYSTRTPDKYIYIYFVYNLREEIRILSDLTKQNIKNVIPLIDYYEDTNLVYIITELCDNNLFEWLLTRFNDKNGLFKVNEQQTAYIFYQIG